MQITAHENGDTDISFEVTMRVGASDKHGSSVTVGGLRFNIQKYYSEETKKYFYVVQNVAYDSRIYGSPDFENTWDAIQWLIKHIQGTSND